jgi:hypothetical protein
MKSRAHAVPLQFLVGAVVIRRRAYSIIQPCLLARAGGLRLALRWSW